MRVYLDTQRARRNKLTSERSATVKEPVSRYLVNDVEIEVPVEGHLSPFMLLFQSKNLRWERAKSINSE